MGFGIYTGGTTGLTDGTLVSASNKLTFPSMATVLDAHIRCGEDEYSAQIDFDDIPSELEIGFEASGNWYWYGIGVAPFYAPTNLGPGNTDVWDVNYPIKLRQVAVPVTADDTFTTDGTVSACTALSTPTLTATVISSTQIDLSWTNVANEDASPGYTIERSLNGSTWSALTTKAQNVTTHSDTGLSASTQYWYRVRAEGSGRYSDSGWGSDDATTDAVPFTDAFTGSDGTALSSHTPTGASTAFTQTYGSPGELRIRSNRCGVYKSTTGAQSARYKCAAADEPSSANCYVEVDCYAQTTDNSYVLVTLRDQGYGSPGYFAYLERNGDVYLGRAGVGILDSDTATLAAQSASTTRRLRLEANGTAIKVFVDDVELCSATDAGVAGADAVSLEVWCDQANSTASNGLAADNLEWGNL